MLAPCTTHVFSATTSGPRKLTGHTVHDAVIKENCMHSAWRLNSDKHRANTYGHNADACHVYHVGRHATAVSFCKSNSAPLPYTAVLQHCYVDMSGKVRPAKKEYSSEGSAQGNGRQHATHILQEHAWHNRSRESQRTPCIQAHDSSSIAPPCKINQFTPCTLTAYSPLVSLTQQHAHRSASVCFHDHNPLSLLTPEDTPNLSKKARTNTADMHRPAIPRHAYICRS